MIDARLDTELLSTDPAPHDNGTTLFEIQSELAWQMSKKTLHAHRLKRTPVKLSVFSHNLASNERKQTGQIVLDLRSLAMPEHLKDADLATVNSLQPKWYPILHSTYWKTQGNLQPEILLKLSIEIDGQEPIDNQILKNQIGSPKKRAAAPRTPKKQTDSEKDGEKYIQIGNPAKTSQEKYTFSLCLKNLTGVLDLIRANSHINLQPDAKLYMYANVFNRDLKFPEFNITDSRPSDIVELAKIRLRANIHELDRELHKQPPLQVHLCCGERSLGAAELKINGLLKQGSISGQQSIRPPLKAVKNELGIKPDSKISLDVALQGPGIDNRSPKVDEALKNKVEQKIENKIQVYEKSDEIKITAENIQRNQDPVEKITPRDNEPQTQPEIQPTVQTQLLPVQRPMIHSQPKISPPQNCRFTFILQIDSLTQFHSPFSSQMHIRYQYPFFTESVIATNEFQTTTGQNREITIDYNKRWHFSTKQTQIEEQFEKNPLELQIWTDDMLVGRAVCQLKFGKNPDLIGEELPPGGGAKCVFESFVKSSSLPVVAASGTSSLGNVNVIVCYKNFDPEVRNEVQLEIPTKPEIPTDPRETSEYKTAIELELWREEQKSTFLKELSTEKTKQLTALKDDFKRRELERESSYRKKLLEYEKLESQLRKGVRDLEAREKSILDQEKQLTQLRDTLTGDKQRFLLDHKAAIERLKKDASHEVEMERKRSGGLKEEVDGLRRKLKEAECDKEKARKDVDRLREDFSTRPDVRAENELKLVMADKVSIEGKLEQANKSKQYYKYQWNRTLQELAKLKQEDQENEREQLKKEQTELGLLKKKLILNNEQQRIMTSQRELNQLTTGLNTEIVLNNRNMGVNTGENDFKNTQNLQGFSELHGTNTQVARLLSEREALMSTGAYTDQDLVISQLDRQIKEAL